VISNKGIFPDPENTRAIKNMKAPTKLKQLRSFFAEKAEPLYHLERKGIKWIWKQEQEGAFIQLKNDLLF